MHTVVHILQNYLSTYLLFELASFIYRFVKKAESLQLRPKNKFPSFIFINKWVSIMFKLVKSKQAIEKIIYGIKIFFTNKENEVGLA